MSAIALGQVYTDLNDNGVYEPGSGEALITASTTVRLTGTDHLGNAVNMSVTTTTGGYTFSGLRPSGPGGYTITEVNQPTGFADGRDTPGTLFGGTGTLGATPRDADAITAIVIPAESNAAAVDYNFGELPTATVGDFVWEDLNGNGQQDMNEPGVNNLTITLTGTNPGGSTFTLTTTTAGNGAYSFTGLRPGTYTVAFTKPVGYVFTIPNAPGVPVDLDSDASRVTGRASVTLAIGETNNTIDAGVFLGPDISGYVYRDFNVNGLREPGAANPETGIGGVRIVLTGTDTVGNVLVPRTTLTAADGSYAFDLLPAGTYLLTEIQPPSVSAAGAAGYYDGLDTLGTVNGAPAGTTPAKNALRVDLAIGDDGIDYNFGELVPADPFGFVYVDQNQNGVRDPGEPGIAGVAVTISGTAFAGSVFARQLVPADVPGGSLTVFTDANGRWEFTPIPPGLYTITETQPAGYADGLEQDADPNGPPTTVGDDAFTDLLLLPFPVRGPFNFGEIIPVRPVPPPNPPPGPIDKSIFLSSTPTGTGFAPSGPPYVNSVAALGVQSPVASIGVAVGTDAGEPGLARLFDFRIAAERLAVDPYPGFTGGVRVAVGDINGDGIDDLVTAPGPGTGVVIKAYSGATGQLIGTAPTGPAGFTGGAFVAVGDINGDRFADVIVSFGAGMGPLVTGFDGATGRSLGSFFAYGSDYLGGVKVALGDLNGDGFDDLVTVPGQGSQIRAIDGQTLVDLASFFAFPPSFLGAVNVAVADMNGDGRGEIVATLAAGSVSYLFVGEVGGAGRHLYTALPLALPPELGLRVAAADINGDGATDLVLSTPANSRVFVVSGRALTPLDDFYAFDASRPGGVYVG